MNESAERNEVLVSIGPILKWLIREEGYNMAKFSRIVGMSFQQLSQVLSSGNATWSTMNRIVQPLGYHFVIQRRHPKPSRPSCIARNRKNPRIMIKQVKFKGKPLKVE